MFRILLLGVTATWIGAAPSAAQNPPVNVTEVARLTRPEPLSYHGVWGMVTPGGREFALVACNNGVWIREFTRESSNAPVDVFFDDSGHPSTTSVLPWRDVTAYGDKVYSVGQGHAGLRVIDMSNPDQPRDDGWFLINEWPGAHTLQLDPDKGRLYINGARTPGADWNMVVVDVSDPNVPPSVLARYTGHTQGLSWVLVLFDTFVRRDRAYVSEIRGDGNRFSILDVSDPTRINATRPIMEVPPLVGSPHGAWVSDDDDLLVTTHESVNPGFGPIGHPALWDISGIDGSPRNLPVLRNFYGAAPHSVHNVFGIGRTMYVAHFTDGVHVVDVADPRLPTRVAYFDTTSTRPGPHRGPLAGPSGNPTWVASYHGCWDVYPHQDSGLIYATDVEHGLFVLKLHVGHFNRFGQGVTAGGNRARIAPAGATPRVGASQFAVVASDVDPGDLLFLVLSPSPRPMSRLAPPIRLLVDEDQMIPLPPQHADSDGRATFALPIPPDPGLTGGRAYMQLIQMNGSGTALKGASRGVWFGVAG